MHRGLQEFRPTASRQPPRDTIGARAWLRTRLFYSWSGTAITLCAAAVAGYFAYEFWRWGLADAIWVADSRRECLDRSPYGACWAGVFEWLPRFIYGRYPDPVQWRVDLVFALLVGWGLPLWSPRHSHKVVLAALLMTGYPFVAGVVLAGGERGGLLQVLFAYGVVATVASFTYIVGAMAVPTTTERWMRRLSRMPSEHDRAGMLGVALAAAVAVALVAWLSRDWTLPRVITNLWGGLFLTFLIALVSITVSLPGGVVLALGRRSSLLFLRTMVIAYIELLRSVPIITVLFMAVTMLPLFLPPGVDMNKLAVALTAICMFSSAYIAEIVRGGLQAVPLGQVEAAQSMGLRYWTTMRLVILPQALRHMIPNIAGSFIGLLKDTTVVSIIGLYDFLLMLRAPGQNSLWIGLYKETLLLGAAVFFLLCFSISRYSRHLERRGHS